MQKISTISVYKRLANDYLVHHKKSMVFAFISMLVAASCSVTSVNLLRPMIDIVFAQKDRNLLLLITLTLLIIYFVKGVAEYYGTYIVKSAAQEILTTMQIQTYNHCIQNDQRFIHSHNAGRLVSRITNDIVLIRTAISTLIAGCTKYFLTIILMLCSMFYINWMLSLIACLLLLLICYPLRYLSAQIFNATQNAQEDIGYFMSKITNNFRAISLIKSFGAEKSESKIIEKIALKMLHMYKKIMKFDSLNYPMFEILSGIIIAFLYWYGGNQICDNQMTPGEVIAFITAFCAVDRPLKSIISLNVHYQETAAASSRIFHILDIKSNIPNSPIAQKPNFDTPPDIEFQSVGLVLNDPKTTLFDNLSFKLLPGKINAIVGYPGNGKTTIVSLLSRFIQHNQGNILIDGLNIQDIDILHLRRNISVLHQENMVFPEITLHDNIAYANETASREDVIKAAKSAQIHEFISQLPNSYDTILADTQIALSGSQKQQISIARTLFKDAPILILDELNNSLDNQSKLQIVNSIVAQKNRKTILMITHDLKTILNADHIIFLDKGKIVEQGNHQTLLAKQQKYYHLYNNCLQ